MADQILAMTRGPAKLQAVTALVEKLTADLSTQTLSSEEHITALEQLKVYGRQPENAGPIFTKDGISMLLKYALDGPSSETSRAALRVLANSMLLVPQTRDYFISESYAPVASQRLKTDNWDDEFLLTRILFFSTYASSADLTTLVKEHQLAENVVNNLKRHAEVRESSTESQVDKMEPMALEETLKFTFNLSQLCSSAVPILTPAAPYIIALFLKLAVKPDAPLDPPVSLTINALINLDLQAERSREALFPEQDPTEVTAKLIQILGTSLNVYEDSPELDSRVAPLVTLLLSIQEEAPDAVKQHMHESLLPKVEDRETVLGRGDSLPAKALKAMTSPLAPQLRQSISFLLFNMSDKDASTFVENVGYGYASGFLFQQNIPIPASATGVAEIGQGSSSQRPVNPITGQFIDRESVSDLPEMTEEEKEREAERLFVLFERLRRTGIIDVQNPVERAVQEGRFEELDDDAEE